MFQNAIRVAINYMFTDTNPSMLPTKYFPITGIIDCKSECQFRRDMKLQERSVQEVCELKTHFRTSENRLVNESGYLVQKSTALMLR